MITTMKPKVILKKFKLKSNTPESLARDHYIDEMISKTAQLSRVQVMLKGLFALSTCFLILIPLLVAAGCNADRSNAFSSENGEADYKNGKDVNFMEENIILDESKPLLDQNIPKHLETATLATG